MDLVMEDLASDGSEPIYSPLHYAGKTLEFCFTHSNSRYGETFYSFVNGQYTSDGGTHLSAFREGLLKAVNEYGNGKFDGDDVRECMVGAVAIRLKDPVFESQTKNKLGNTEIRTELVNNVREELLHFFQRNKQIAETIMAKVKDTQQLRKELQEVKKLSRERAKAITLRIPQLKDCKHHFDKKKDKGRGTMVFICEGQSAAGSITSCRDVNNQAVFVLKGKPLNVWDLKRDVMYKNDEMYNLMQALSVEDTTESLRYEKVILATDADVDGMHIRNLMITYFFKFFEQLVHDGHVYVLETPLFRVRNKEKTIYCYSETERDKRHQGTRRQAGDHAVQGSGRNQPQGIRAVHRQRNAPEQGGIRPARRVRAHLRFLHGQEHAGAQGLHHGQPGRAGGGVRDCLKNRRRIAQTSISRCQPTPCRSAALKIRSQSCKSYIADWASGFESKARTVTKPAWAGNCLSGGNLVSSTSLSRISATRFGAMLMKSEIGRTRNSVASASKTSADCASRLPSIMVSNPSMSRSRTMKNADPISKAVAQSLTGVVKVSTPNNK